MMIIEMIKEFRRRMDKQTEKLEVFNKKLENMKKYQIEVKHTLTEVKNALEGTDRVDDTEGWISELEDRVMEITEAEQERKQNQKK